MTEIAFLAGAAMRRITPALDGPPIFLAGFQPNRRATGIDLDLYVRALAMRTDETSVVLVAVDLIGLTLPDIEDIRNRIAEHGLAAQNVIVACTHTHSGPDTIGLWGPQEGLTGRNVIYQEFLKQAIVDIAIEALTFCCPVRMRYATSYLPEFVKNYRTPEIVDNEVAVVQFVKPDGEIVATLLNLACHPEVLDGESTLLSADYAGAACAAVEAAVGGTALHISGALGGMLSPNIAERSPDGVQRMGRAYAEVALAALASAELCEVPRLAFQRKRFLLPQANPLFRMVQEIGLTRSRPEINGMLATECAYLDLGPVQIASIPGELLPRLGFQLKAAMPGPCRILAGIADDELGYILPDDEFITPADYRNPGAQYEESMSVGPETGSRFMQAALALIQPS
jgi:hypothetical protein